MIILERIKQSKVVCKPDLLLLASKRNGKNARNVSIIALNQRNPSPVLELVFLLKIDI